MQIKKLTVKSISEAMDKIRKEFGEDAYILETKKVKKGGFFGIGGQKYLEVTVLSENNEIRQDKKTDDKIKKASNSTYSLTDLLKRNSESIYRTNNKHQINNSYQQNLDEKILNSEFLNFIEKNRQISAKLDESAKSFYQKNENKNNMESIPNQNIPKESLQLDELKKMVQNLNKKMEVNNQYLMDIKEELYNKSYSKNFIRSFLSTLEDIKIEENWKKQEIIKNRFEKRLTQCINTKNFHEIKGKVMFIGPTGVGKTTTLAKIAAKLKKESKKVAIVTIDTYRIAATDQLKTYADILDLPLYVCYTPQDLKFTLESLLSYDTILIDTAGRSHKNNLQMGELKVYIDTIKPDFTIMLISSNINCEDMMHIFDSYSYLNPDELIFTKLDETSSYGQIFSFLDYSGLPFLGITDGQRVPEDIKFASKEWLIELAVEEVFK